ncbi:DUF420 domain-containing protein [Mucilaginibacter myungsuensis]|uniref:DUF420 domain-containing protein n=1 Tax=Mucilaginibacter myungsuensis TaxID=649104 RepID=A0A929L085_9SPHI|nr:DUF420 domain-containing protein [Mucilaginibacter myungsuensis]MBE9664437.1 DUF420 domain-containing protein [Mucilaginibacter myungsuensis]MDN3601418.1 DUF420 domain-containing protein [Mucilaginibacter myungsuensis]
MTDKFIFRFVAGLSVFVFVVVVILESKVIPAPKELPSFTYFLPKLNAIFNGTCSVLLVASLFAIKRKNIGLHKKLNITAFILSALFLVSYILFHYLAPQTVYGDLNGNHKLDDAEKLAIGGIRYVYYLILVTHIILAAGVLPLILLSFYRGLQMQVEKHRKLVRWTFPIWLYVTVTGVIVYLMIAPYY